MYDTTLSQIYAKDMGAMQKENKRCIPKEGMPHASACQKKREKRIKDAYPKKVCHMLMHVKTKEKERWPLSKKKEKERWFIQKEFIHHPLKKIHTLAYLDQGL